MRIPQNGSDNQQECLAALPGKDRFGEVQFRMEKDQQREQFETSGEHIEDQDDLAECAERSIVAGGTDNGEARADIVEGSRHRGERRGVVKTVERYQKCE